MNEMTRPMGDLEATWDRYTQDLKQAAAYTKHADERAAWAGEDDEIVKEYRARAIVKTERLPEPIR